MSENQERDERLMRDPDEIEDWAASPDVDLMRRAYKLLYSMLSEAAPYLAKTDFGELNEVMVALDRRVNVR